MQVHFDRYNIYNIHKPGIVERPVNFLMMEKISILSKQATFHTDHHLQSPSQ